MAKRYFTEEQVKILVWNNEVDRVEGENRGWTRTNTSIVKADDGKFYEVDWEEGLTECQDDEYYAGWYDEVEQVTYQKTITVTDWKIIE